MFRNKDRYLSLLLVLPSILAILIFVLWIYCLVSASFFQQMERPHSGLYVCRTWKIICNYLRILAFTWMSETQ